MSDDRKTAPTTFWVAALLLGLPLFYGLLLGPACWLTSRVGGGKVVTVLYKPVTWSIETVGNEWLMERFQRYCDWGASNYFYWALNSADPGNAEWTPVLSIDLDYLRTGASPPP